MSCRALGKREVAFLGGYDKNNSLGCLQTIELSRHKAATQRWGLYAQTQYKLAHPLLWDQHNSRTFLYDNKLDNTQVVGENVQDTELTVDLDL